MFDYYDKVHSMSDDKLVEEIQNLYKKLSVINAQSPIYNQILDMLSTAESTYHERLTVNRIKNKSGSSVIEIGSVDESVYTPDYSTDELLLAVVSQYTQNIKKDNT